MSTESTSTASISGTPSSSLEVALAAAKAALDKRTENLKILDLTELSGFTEYFVICSGTSDRQVQSIVDHIGNELQKAGREWLSCEGYGDGRWVLADFGDVVVHVFQEALREYYDLESLWSDAPRVKIPSEFYGTGGSRLN